jgi:hypothetical protein
MNRPTPPQSLLDAEAILFPVVAPAPELKAWVHETFLAETGELHNPQHAHLIDSDVEFMWASTAFEKKGRTVLGQCEQVMLRAGGWQKVRLEQQFRDWFGRVPKFLITIAADYSAECSDTEFCELVEHEMMHIAQATDEYGAPKFNQEGKPVLTIRGHDVEEFIDIVKRYGASHEVQQMVDAANGKPEVAKTNIARACGTCIRSVA